MVKQTYVMIKTQKLSAVWSQELGNPYLATAYPYYDTIHIVECSNHFSPASVGLFFGNFHPNLPCKSKMHFKSIHENGNTKEIVCI